MAGEVTVSPLHLGHVPWRPCEPSRRTQTGHQAGERSSPDPGDSRDQGTAERDRSRRRRMPSQDGQGQAGEPMTAGTCRRAWMIARRRPNTYAGLVPRGRALGPCRRGSGVRRRRQGRPLKVAPTIPRLIDRGDLLAALDRAAAGKVTIISAPAGSGKTSLLRAWADRPGQPHELAVIQVQRDQQDAQQFWLGLLDAGRQAPGTASRAEAPAATPGFNGRAMVERVLAELADHHGRVILIIDDLHELHSPEALAQLTRLLTNLPPHVHAVLATRRDLQLRLHRLRLAGELTELR